MNVHRLAIAALLLAGQFALPQALRAAESYDNCAGTVSSLPATVSTQGVWCLKSDLGTAIESGAAITIATNNVTIDCNGFKLGGLAAGINSGAYGILASARQNITVRHCNVRGFWTGVLLYGGAGHLVEDNRLDGNLFAGIYVVGDGNRVRRNAVYDTGGDPDGTTSVGILAEGDVSGNAVADVFVSGSDGASTGIRIIGDGHRVSDNRVRELVASGSGVVKGIDVPGNDNDLRDNTLAAAGTGIDVAGVGISHEGGASANFCTGNTMADFATASTNCQDGGGNGFH